MANRRKSVKRTWLGERSSNETEDEQFWWSFWFVCWPFRSHSTPKGLCPCSWWVGQAAGAPKRRHAGNKIGLRTFKHLPIETCDFFFFKEMLAPFESFWFVICLRSMPGIFTCRRRLTLHLKALVYVRYSRMYRGAIPCMPGFGEVFEWFRFTQFTPLFVFFSLHTGGTQTLGETFRQKLRKIVSSTCFEVGELQKVSNTLHRCTGICIDFQAVAGIIILSNAVSWLKSFFWEAFNYSSTLKY